MRRTTMLVAGAALAALAPLVLAAGCSSGGDDAAPGTSEVPAVAAGARDEVAPAVTRPGVDPAAGDGASAPGLSTEGACGLLLPTEVGAATGGIPTGSSPLEGGCRWVRGGVVVVELTAEPVPGEGDAATVLAQVRAARSTPDRVPPALGPEAFADRDGRVWWLQQGDIHALVVPGGDRPAALAAAGSLARQVADRLG